jgi:hypothetical protein
VLEKNATLLWWLGATKECHTFVVRRTCGVATSGPKPNISIVIFFSFSHLCCGIQNFTKLLTLPKFVGIEIACLQSIEVMP